MKFWIGLFVSFIIGFGFSWVVFHYNFSQSVISPVDEASQIKEKPLLKYTIDNLRKRQFAGSEIILDEQIETSDFFTAYKFHFLSDGKKVTGLVHLPASDSGNQHIKLYPVIVQFRGYVDHEIYAPGVGTKRSAEVFAKNGFISLAPDFLGYGGSDNPSVNVFEERFETYITALNLLQSVSTLPQADSTKIGIWGHSNGGQIALTVLEITSIPYPTTLWAPVTKPFPYSILYYTDEFDDKGKMLRKKLAEFEADYDADLYSLRGNNLQYIHSTIQLHQGTADSEVPQKWSGELVDELKTNHVDINYFVYPGADHNLAGGWEKVVLRDVEFFKKNLE